MASLLPSCASCSLTVVNPRYGQCSCPKASSAEPTLASLQRSSASCALISHSCAFSVAALSSSSCFFWYRGALLRLSRSAYGYGTMQLCSAKWLPDSKGTPMDRSAQSEAYK